MTTRISLALLLALATGCGNECRYFEQCADESTLLQCGGGVDQVVGRKVSEVPCDEDNPVCVSEDEDHAACVAATECNASVPSRCDGTKLVSCGEVRTVLNGSLEGPYETVVDCVAVIGEAGTCVEADGVAGCQ